MSPAPFSSSDPLLAYILTALTLPDILISPTLQDVFEDSPERLVAFYEAVSGVSVDDEDLVDGTS